MSEPAFAINLGNGLYMDSEGELHEGPLPNVPIYKAPFTLPIDPKQLKEATSGVKSALLNINKEGFLHDRWGKVDEIDKLLDLLAGIGKLAAVFSTLASVYSFAADAAKFLGLLKDGPSALERLVEQRFNELEAKVAAIAQQIQRLDLRNGRVSVGSLVNQVQAYVETLKQANPTPQELENDRIGLLNSYASHIDLIASLLDRQTWISDFSRGDHTQVWPLIAGVLFTVPGVKVEPDPGEPSGPDVLPAPLPLNGANFDHRLMVPVASSVAMNYLTAIRGISPEYRTTAEFAPDIRRFASNLGDLADLMRQHVLARTIYSREHFAWPVLVPPYDVVHSGPLGLGVPTIAPTCGRWPVGAIDLRYHDDTYFNAFIIQLGLDEALGRPGSSRFGLMDVRWTPPAILEPSDFGNYRITNPEECAAAANAQSEKDYAGLLTVSGYPELLRLATLFRNEAAEPPKSQTVHAEAPRCYRNPLPSSTVTVQGNPVHFTGQIIKATARREPQECMDTIGLWTQPIKRARPIEYRVKLRTLASFASDDVWREPVYSDYQRVGYEPDPAHIHFQRLALSTTYAEIDSHDIIADWTASPRDEPRHLTDRIDMTADTFDWWIPVATPFQIDKPFDQTLAHMRAGGWPGLEWTGALPAPGGLQLMNRILPGDSVGNNYDIPELFWKRGQDWDGQHRDLRRRETVHLEYELDWTADRLNLSIKDSDTHRNYIVFLVLEEKMQASTNILHTAVALPINGLLTYVPQDFFDQEFAAHAQTASIIADQIAKFVPGAGDVGRIDPVIGWVRPADLATRAGVNRVLELAREHRPELLDEITAALSEVRTMRKP